MTTNDVGPCTGATNPDLERPHYFYGKLLTAKDFLQEQEYFRSKLRRHNRLLHGWGVVCGAAVAQTGPCEVSVDPGYVLGPCGDEIVIDHTEPVELCPRSPEPDRCDEAGSRRGDRDPAKGTLYLAVRYAECGTNPVPALVGEIDETTSEWMGIRDHYQIRVLDELPKGYGRRGTQMPEPDPETVDCAGGHLGSCPPCPDTPWVILATLTLRDGHIGISNRYRRQVVSHAASTMPCE